MPADGLLHDSQKALRYVWLVLACISGLALVAPLVLPSDFLFTLFPVCQAKAAGGECFFCGMTTAFVRIGQGDLTGAQSANKGSLLLYLGLALNFTAAAAYTMMRVIRHANR
jgi:hypothetical protein